MQTHIRLASPGQDVTLPPFALASSTRRSRLPVEHFPAEDDNPSEMRSPIQSMAGYTDPPFDEAEDHATDGTPDYVDDSDIYAGSESESSESDEDEEEEEFEEFDEEEDMEMMDD